MAVLDIKLAQTTASGSLPYRQCLATAKFPRTMSVCAPNLKQNTESVDAALLSEVLLVLKFVRKQCASMKVFCTRAK